MLVSESHGTSTGMGNHSFAAQICRRGNLLRAILYSSQLVFMRDGISSFPQSLKCIWIHYLGEKNNFIKKLEKAKDQSEFHGPDNMFSSSQCNSI